MKPNLTTTSKIEKKRILLKHIISILPTPCGCIPKLAACDCPDEHCPCDLELEYCECAEDWPIEFLGKIGDMLAAADPDTYADRPEPPTPIRTLAHDARLARYEGRNDMGCRLWHPDDLKPENVRSGAVVRTQRNGAVKFGMASEGPENVKRGRWRGKAQKASHVCDDFGAISVEDLVTASEG